MKQQEIDIIAKVIGRHMIAFDKRLAALERGSGTGPQRRVLGDVDMDEPMRHKDASAPEVRTVAETVRTDYQAGQKLRVRFRGEWQPGREYFFRDGAHDAVRYKGGLWAASVNYLKSEPTVDRICWQRVQ